MDMLRFELFLLVLLGGLNSLSRLLSVRVSCPKECLSSLISNSALSTYWVCNKRFQLVWY